MRIMAVGLCLCATAFISGCTPVVSVYPLYTKTEIETPHLDQRLEGEWIMAKMDDTDENAASPRAPCHVSIAKSMSVNFPYTVAFRCPNSPGGPGEDYSKYDFQLVSIQNSLFFDAQFVESEQKGKHGFLSDIADKGVAPAHLLGQVWVQQDLVRFSPIASDWAEENWPAGFLVRSEVAKYSRVDILTNPTSDLRDLLNRNSSSETAFGIPLYLCRAGVDCNLRAMEDQLTRTPNNPEVLAGSVKFYAKRGDFARAIALQRHKIELSSDPGTDQYELARLLLLTRDFEGARGALAAAKEPVEKPSIGELVVRSHFLQGDYAKTVQAAKSYKAPPNIVSVDPMVLCYFAMYRLGRAKEAESYVREQAATFVGPAQEHLLLLSLLGRVTDSSPAEDQVRNSYYYALNELRKGNVDHGRSHLQDLTRMQSKDSLIGLAAQIELERLASTVPQK